MSGVSGSRSDARPLKTLAGGRSGGLQYHHSSPLWAVRASPRKREALPGMAGPLRIQVIISPVCRG